MSEGDEDFDERMENPKLSSKSLRNKAGHQIKEKMPPLLSTIGTNTEVID